MNQMEIFKNPEFGSIGSSRKMANSCFLVWMWQMRLDTAIPALQFPALPVRHETRRTPSTKLRENHSDDFYPEGDVYRLIVTAKLPSAERFERWVFDEVLPSIRQHWGRTLPGTSCGRSPLPRKPC